MTSKSRFWWPVAGLSLIALVSGLVTYIFQAYQPVDLTTEYVALGDSYAANPGVGSASAGVPIPCRRSHSNYPNQVAKITKLRLADSSCANSKISDLLNNNSHYFLPAQIGVLTRRTELVTVHIGIEDVGLIENMYSASCSKLPITWKINSCPSYSDAEVAEKFAQLPSQLNKLVNRIKATSPKAKVILLGYPNFIPNKQSCYKRMPINSALITKFHRQLSRLNKIIKTTANQQAIRYLNPTSGQSICGKTSPVFGFKFAANSLVFGPAPYLLSSPAVTKTAQEIAKTFTAP